MWKKSPLTGKAEYLPALNRAEPAYRFLPETTLIDELPLPFYADAKLLRVTRATAFPKPLWYVWFAGTLVVLDGSAANVNYLDDTAGLTLTAETQSAHEAFRAAFGNGPLPENFEL